MSLLDKRIPASEGIGTGFSLARYQDDGWLWESCLDGFVAERGDSTSEAAAIEAALQSLMAAIEARENP